MERVWNKIDSRNICYGGGWEDVKITVRANVFGIMLDLAKSRVEHYVSDLYHDALWINTEVTGPRSFDWVARESGTFIGESAGYCKLEDWEKATKYRFEIMVEGNAKWMVNIYEAVLASENRVNVPDTIDYGARYRDAMQEPIQPWVDQHAALDISECENAKSIEGCIFHPAPLGGWTMIEDLGDRVEDPLDVSCTGYKGFSGIQHDGDTCPVHEDQGARIWNNEHVTPQEFPTLRNEEFQTTQPIIKDGKRKVKFNMDDILRDLREKLDEANSARDEAYDAKNELDDAISEFDNYIDEVDNLIGSLESLPSISVDLDVRVSFES